MQAVSDFSRGKVSGNILRLAMPMVVAQLVNVLYNIVDRMYIGHMPEDSVNALTGVGLTFPILLIVTAFANLFGTGGMPLFSMARGAAQHEDGDAQRRRAATVMKRRGRENPPQVDKREGLCRRSLTGTYPPFL